MTLMQVYFVWVAYATIMLTAFTDRSVRLRVFPLILFIAFSGPMLAVIVLLFPIIGNPKWNGCGRGGNMSSDGGQ